jgi:hypothetical protein
MPAAVCVPVCVPLCAAVCRCVPACSCVPAGRGGRAGRPRPQGAAGPSRAAGDRRGEGPARAGRRAGHAGAAGTGAAHAVYKYCVWRERYPRRDRCCACTNMHRMHLRSTPDVSPDISPDIPPDISPDISPDIIEVDPVLAGSELALSGRVSPLLSLLASSSHRTSMSLASTSRVRRASRVCCYLAMRLVPGWFRRTCSNLSLHLGCG